MYCHPSIDVIFRAGDKGCIAGSKKCYKLCNLCGFTDAIKRHPLRGFLMEGSDACFIQAGFGQNGRFDRPGFTVFTRIPRSCQLAAQRTAQ